MLNDFLLILTTNNQNVLRFEKEAIVNIMLMNSREFENDTILNYNQSID